jgi:phage-related baseplate assembly protein
MARFNLPDIDFVEVDAEELEAIAVGKFEELMQTTLTRSDPRRKFIQAVVFLATVLANNIDFTGKQRLLAYATDNYLDHLGAKKNVPRLEPKPAQTIIRFEVNPVETSVIPKGTRMAVNDIMFESTTDTTVNPGDTSVDVTFVCQEPGTIGNGFLPGQITNLVDPLPWVTKAYNITTSEGGVDWEEDDPYAERIRQSNESYSTAGPEGAYEFFAKSANQSIVDVLVTSPSDGVVEIRPLLKDGVIPSQDVLDQVYEKCNARTVRPLTDHVVVLAPEAVNYNLTATYYISSENQNLVNDIQAKVDAVVQEYLIWQKSKLGRGIDPGEFVTRLKNAGAYRVIVETPTGYTPLQPHQVAQEQTVSVTFGGVVND